MTEFRVNRDDPTHALAQVWPPFGLRIESPQLVLRQVRESDFPAYVAAASSGIMTTGRNSFASPWDENSPEDIAKNSLTWLWSKRPAIGPDSWYLMLAVFTRHDDGTEDSLIGMQDVWAEDYRVLRTVQSASWLRADAQGKGYGKEQRAAMLMWAFDHFGAEYAESGAYDWNEPSKRVSESLGYFQCGTRRVTDAHGRQPEWEIQYRMAKNDFLRPSWSVQVEGNELLQDFMLLSSRHRAQQNPAPEQHA
ncbi:GNAT family N-acetyltransferase [Nesterenkonia sphaerica]|uniref:GNAT family N-acetyltransferase n=1 Tax=Nesterenkonia sphaerica TaxID=1804988 RepID=A0A5R9A7H8_9MICC|nr:GNAT family protein [Nesterenkonia sphaerica]TLP74470.1 GNAT family N-acetyltransferase [Nesterenkonia sphaerica]